MWDQEGVFNLEGWNLGTEVGPCSKSFLVLFIFLVLPQYPEEKD